MKVVHVLSQRPLLTGSGVTLAELCRQAGDAGWEQHVVCGLPGDEPAPSLPGVPTRHLTAVRFGAAARRASAPLEFDIPGMSDVMPYASTRWRDMDSGQLAAYRGAWRNTLAEVIERVQPDVVHAHHLWLVSALVSALVHDIAPRARLVVHCHATGLRQLELCPALAEEVVAGVRRADAVVALHDEQARTIAERFDMAPERIHVVGAGYAEDVFHARGREDADADEAADLGVGADLDAGVGVDESERYDIVFAGKLAAAKGVPWLLDAFARVRRERPAARLHLVGGAGGDEGAALAARAKEQPGVVVHGRVLDLAALLRRCRVFVLPSMYEGLPLVLIEARACGCRLVATALPGVISHLAPALGDALEVVDLPRRRNVDVPVEEDLPAFIDALQAALTRALDAPRPPPPDHALAPFRWSAVFARIERVWRS